MYLVSKPFLRINSTTTSFAVSASTAALQWPLESSDRRWSSPSGRSVRVVNGGSEDIFVIFGTSAQALPTPGGSGTQQLAGTVQVYFVSPSQTHVGIISTSSDGTTPVNITLGYGR